MYKIFHLTESINLKENMKCCAYDEEHLFQIATVSCYVCKMQNTFPCVSRSRPRILTRRAIYHNTEVVPF